MKKFVLFLFLGSILLNYTGCVKSPDVCTPKTVESEEAQILAYANANSIITTRHSSGLYYQIISAGSGTTPNPNSRIFIRYVGKLMNGVIFDQKDDHTQTGWTLGTLIAGWQFGVPLIQKGGKIRLIIPSALAYGCQANGPIPANSILYFEIELIDVQ